MKRIRCIAVGDQITQKTCLLYTYQTNAFAGEYTPKYIDAYSQNMIIDDIPINMSLQDIGIDLGIDNQKIRPLSYYSADVIIVTFHIAKPTTLDDVETIWIPEMNEYCPGKPIILVATCSDFLDDPSLLEEGDRIIEDKEVFEIMKKHITIYDYIKCSARKYRNVDIIFQTAAKAALEGNRSLELINKVENLGLIIGKISIRFKSKEDPKLMLISYSDLIRINRKPSILVISFSDKKSLDDIMDIHQEVHNVQKTFDRVILIKIKIDDGLEAMDIDIKQLKRFYGAKTLIEIDESWTWDRFRDCLLDINYVTDPYAESINKECKIA